MSISQNDLIRETGALINQLEREWKEISVTGNIQALQKDSLRLILIRLYNQVNQIKTSAAIIDIPQPEISERVQVPAVQIITEDIAETKDQHEISINENLTAIMDIIVPDEVPPQNIEISEKTMVQSTVSMEIKSEIKTTSIRETYAPKLFDEPVTVASKFSSHESLSEKISKGKKDDSFAERHHKSPVTDLKKSIGINEKFAFINELFKGNQESFHNSIEKLNNASDYINASDIMKAELASQYNWDTNSKIFNELDLLVKRRFGMQ